MGSLTKRNITKLLFQQQKRHFDLCGDDILLIHYVFLVSTKENFINELGQLSMTKKPVHIDQIWLKVGVMQ